MISAKTIYQKASDFSFSTSYKGRLLNLTIKPDSDRFAVLHNDDVFGHIKIGYDRHTWYVIKSNYVDYELVKEIGHRIIERFY